MVTYTHHQRDNPQGMSVDGRRKTEDSMIKCQSRVSQEWYVHRAQVEGVEGPMGNITQVAANKGRVLVPLTRLQHLVDSEVLFKKKRRSDTTSQPSSRGRNRLFRTREPVGKWDRHPEPEGNRGLRYLLLAMPCSNKQPLATRMIRSSEV